ncbi:MAG: DUF5908 family protein [Nannocystaceae bacterium]
MPVEIKELVIRAVVREPEPDEGSPAAATAAALGDDERAALIEACVVEVLRVLRREREP